MDRFKICAMCKKVDLFANLFIYASIFSLDCTHFVKSWGVGDGYGVRVSHEI